MKKFLLLGIILLMIAIITPIASSVEKTKTLEATTPSSEQATTASAESEEDIEKIVSMTLEFIDEDTTKETKKALIALCRNNYSYNKLHNKDTETSEITNFSDELYEEMCYLFKEINTELRYKGEPVYIPLLHLSSSATATSDEYPYMLSVASPWDTFDESFNSKSEYPCGVSIKGIDYLCGNGMNYTEALQWYLPEFEISE